MIKRKMNGKKNITISYIIAYKLYSLLGKCCRMAFTAFFPGKLSAEKPLSDTDLVLFSGLRGAPMMKAVLLSIYYNWEKIPRLTIVSDGTPIDVLEKAMQFWPFPYEIKPWTDCADFHLARGRQSLVDFAKLNPYSRKLLTVLAEAETRPILYCDTDVLWFAEPRLPAHQPGNGCTMRISLDNDYHYHLPAIRWLDRFDLMDKPAFNCGVIYLSGSVYDNYPGFAELIHFMRIFTEPFAEQTTFALLADRFGDTWTLEEIINSTADAYWPLIPKYFFSGGQLARHHVATKHSWFWRDALFLVLLKRKKYRAVPHATAQHS
jgi:hypothetical protein